MGAELFHAEDGRTDMTKLIVAFRKFSKASTKLVWVWRLSVVVVNIVSCKPGVGRLACNAWLKSGEMVYIQQVSSVWWLYSGVFLVATRTRENFVQQQFNKNFSPSKYYRKWEVEDLLRPNTDKWRRDAAQETRNFIKWQHKKYIKSWYSCP